MGSSPTSGNACCCPATRATTQGRAEQFRAGAVAARGCDLLLQALGLPSATPGRVSSARSVAVSYKPPMLVTRVRLPACALSRAAASFWPPVVATGCRGSWFSGSPAVACAMLEAGNPIL